jgi:hypothetical protein
MPRPFTYYIKSKKNSLGIVEKSFDEAIRDLRDGEETIQDFDSNVKSNFKLLDVIRDYHPWCCFCIFVRFLLFTLNFADV